MPALAGNSGSQPAVAVELCTGLSRRRSRVRVPSLPSLFAGIIPAYSRSARSRRGRCTPRRPPTVTRRAVLVIEVAHAVQHLLSAVVLDVSLVDEADLLHDASRRDVGRLRVGDQIVDAVRGGVADQPRRDLRAQPPAPHFGSERVADLYLLAPADLDAADRAAADEAAGRPIAEDKDACPGSAAWPRLRSSH